jgi:hypothetical protein
MARFRAGLAIVLAATLSASIAWAEAPPVSDPSARLIEGFNAPGTFPTTVNAANVNIRPEAGAEFDGAGEDILRVEFPAAGPLKWTSSRFNSGDIALSIGPAFPENPLSYPEPAFVNNFQALQGNSDPINPNSRELTTLAWRVGGATGALFATPRHNGVNDGYVSGGNPVGEIFGVAYFNSGASQGWGFRLENGEFANGGLSSSDLTLGAAGSAFGGAEAVSNTAVAYLPYEQGWQGAWVTPAFDGEGTYGNGNPDLLAAPSAVQWASGIATIMLPEVNSATDGMLFVAPSSTSSNTRLAAAFPTGGGWKATVRLDEDVDTSGNTVLDADNGFQFLYIPYTATNLIGGHIQGSNGSAITSAGDARFDVTRNSAGQYAVSVYEADGTTKKSEGDGMLMLSVASSMPGAPGVPDRTFLSYEFDAGSGNFIVESRELLSLSGSDDFFGNDFELRDSNFYFAWVDFENPLSLGGAAVPGDFDGDGDVDGADLTQWRGAHGTNAGGDADGDGDTDGNDFLVWQQNVGFGLPATGAAGAVPEPTSLVMTVLAGAACLGAARRRR